jgi:hypothetical protein
MAFKDDYYRPKSLAELVQWVRKYYPDYRPSGHKQAWAIYYSVIREHQREVTL